MKPRRPGVLVTVVTMRFMKFIFIFTLITARIERREAPMPLEALLAVGFISSLILFDIFQGQMFFKSCKKYASELYCLRKIYNDDFFWN